MVNATFSAGGGGGGGSSGLPVVRNPSGNTGPKVMVGGVEVITTTAEQQSGVEAPTKSIEHGAEISQRNVIKPESGSITGAVSGSGLSSLRGLARRRQPISITTPESTIKKCVVENVRRTREGQHVSKFGVTIQWRQVLLANVGSVVITAVTDDGKKSPSSGDTGSVSLAEAESKKTPKGTNGDGENDTFVEQILPDWTGY